MGVPRILQALAKDNPKIAFLAPGLGTHNDPVCGSALVSIITFGGLHVVSSFTFSFPLAAYTPINAQDGN